MLLYISVQVGVGSAAEYEHLPSLIGGSVEITGGTAGYRGIGSACAGRGVAGALICHCSSTLSSMPVDSRYLSPTENVVLDTPPGVWPRYCL